MYFLNLTNSNFKLLILAHTYIGTYECVCVCPRLRCKPPLVLCVLCREECAALRLELTARHKEESQAIRAELVSRKEKELQEERARWQTEVERLKELVSTAACVCAVPWQHPTC